ncbi:class I adenylate-forming enzyme family protein [Paenibacillus wynnii]|uniref:class I adenylate-forming enzyme family protein n=1 Tax=Paenibacillus wynnii TaxID=268407 RepID=UPI002791B7AC|nr:AMP-binding protein [Paenibacillus wynnii]MDQ0195265.1 long-chain acyl-CoA synthetase [Paenibacillus wynnii]
MNLVQHILERGQIDPYRIAISDGREERTYAQLMRLVQQVSNGLRQGGHAKRNIAVLSGNRMEFAEFVLGAIYAGCVPVLLDPKWPPGEIDKVIRQCEPGLIASEGRFAADLSERYQEIPQLYFGEDQQAGSYCSWLAGFEPNAMAEENPELLFIGYTSGTTGFPKGYMRTHLSWLRSCEATEKEFRLNRIKHVLAPGPFVHSLSLFAMMQSLYSMATFHLLQEFNAESILNLCSREPDMILFVVPTMIDTLLHLAATSTAQISMQAVISSGGKWPESSKQRCRELFKDTKLYESYGSSEASYISYLEVTGEEQPDSLGKAFDGVHISIRDEQFREVPPGTVGELYIRSEMMFAGYHQLPEETASVFRDGWLRTGDYMLLDQDMHLHLAGRASNMIKSGGLKVFPEEVEAVLLRIPAIREVMIFGKPDDRWGEQVTALIQWNGEQRISLDEMRNYCRPYLASYKIPKQLIAVERFIYTSSGKIARQLMKDDVREGMI